MKITAPAPVECLDDAQSDAKETTTELQHRVNKTSRALVVPDEVFFIADSLKSNLDKIDYGTKRDKTNLSSEPPRKPTSSNRALPAVCDGARSATAGSSQHNKERFTPRNSGNTNTTTNKLEKRRQNYGLDRKETKKAHPVSATTRQSRATPARQLETRSAARWIAQ